MKSKLLFGLLCIAVGIGLTVWVGSSFFIAPIAPLSMGGAYRCFCSIRGGLHVYQPSGDWTPQNVI